MGELVTACYTREPRQGQYHPGNMCGIAGIFAFSATAANVSREELRATRDAMAPRGPDAAGEWFSDCGRVALGHRRLAIIDLSPLGEQPMASQDGRLQLVFNGEIYNYRELRAELEQSGYEFRSHSDSEVLLALYERDGRNMLSRLRGMYAFGLWDAHKRGLLLARDPYGIKPLYYALEGGVLRFASQVRALLAGGQVSKQLDPAGQAGFLMWGAVPEPFTYYKSVSALMAGNALWVDERGPGPLEQHGSITQVWREAAKRAADPGDSLSPASVHDALRESVRFHLVADVEVGIFLSGGVDSGALAGLMRERTSAPIHGVTLEFAEFRDSHDDEVPLARRVARQYGITHHLRRVGRDEFLSDLPRIFAAMDQPSIDGVNSWFVSKAAAERALKVVISGLGGDELFGGYNSFTDVPRLVSLAGLPARVPGLGRLVREVLKPLVRFAPLHPKLPSTLEMGGDVRSAYQLKRGLFLPWELGDVMPEAALHEAFERLAAQGGAASELPVEPYAAVAALEAESYMRNQLLRDVDWASMAHSLEVRVPLVDTRLTQQVAPYVVRHRPVGKRVLGEVARDPLPEVILSRPKTGFTTPVASWMASAPELDSWQRVPVLRRNGCPWARRYAYALTDLFSGA